MVLHNRAGHDADVVLPGQRAVFLQVGFPLRAQVDEAGVLGDPIGQMVLGQHGELRALRGRGRDVLCGFVVVVRDLHRLQRERKEGLAGEPEVGGEGKREGGDGGNLRVGLNDGHFVDWGHHGLSIRGGLLSGSLRSLLESLNDDALNPSR